MTRYRATYRYLGRIQDVLMPQHFGVNDILDGFWLNEQFKWTCGGDCQYRIPPSQILLITKEDFPDNT